MGMKNIVHFAVYCTKSLTLNINHVLCRDYDSCILRAWLKAVLAGSKLGQLSKTFSLIPDNECLEVSLIVSQFSLGQK